MDTKAPTESKGDQAPKPVKQVQVVGDLPPAPKFSSNHLQEAAKSSQSDAEDSAGEDEPHEADQGPEDEDSDAEDAAGSTAALAAANGSIAGAGPDEEEIDDATLLDRFDPEETRIDLTHLRLTSKNLRKIGLPRFKETLEYLGLRQNAISRLTDKDVGALSKLKELDLYDNQLEKLGHSLEGCKDLEILDLSFNNFKHVPYVSHLAKCHTLYFVQNKISRLRPEDFAPPIRLTLRSLELGGNKLRSMDHLAELDNLEELWLGKNKITKLENLAKMTKLRVLSIQSNRITKLENLEALTNLEELYISHNGLSKIEGLEKNTQLTTVDVAGNKIKVVENVGHLSKLEEFWANDNQIEDINRIGEELGPDKIPSLSTVYLEGNPAQRKEGAAYRRKLILALPQIRQIDATLIRA